MDRKTATLSAAAALTIAPVIAAGSAAHAETPAVPVAASYAELLQPVPDAVERLRVADAQAAARPPRLIEAQWAPPYPHHHHHHHHHHHRAWYLSHGYYWSGGAWLLGPPPHHHHHHHHHHNHY